MPSRKMAARTSFMDGLSLQLLRGTSVEHLERSQLITIVMPQLSWTDFAGR